MFKRIERLKTYFKFENILQILFLFTLILIFSTLYYLGMVDKLELLAYDLKTACAVTDKNLKSDQNIYLVELNNNSLKEVDNLKLDFNLWPWPRRVMKEALEYVSKGKPKAIIYRFTFPVKENPIVDKQLSTIMEETEQFYGMMKINSIKAKTIEKIIKLLVRKEINPQEILKLSNERYQYISQSADYNTIARAIAEKDLKNFDYLPIPSHLSTQVELKDLGKDSEILDNITFSWHDNIPDIFSKAYKKLAVAYYISDKDGLVRRDQPIFRYAKDNSFFPSTSFSILANYYGKGKVELGNGYIKVKDKVIPTDSKGRVAINFRYNYTPDYPGTNLLNLVMSNRIENNTVKLSDEQKKKFYINKSEFKDKYVIIGSSTLDTGTMAYTNSPWNKNLNSMNYLGIILDNYLNCGKGHYENFVSYPPIYAVSILTVLFCLLNVFLIFKFENIIAKFSMIFVGVAFYILFSFSIFVIPQFRYDIPVVFPVFVILFASLCTFFVQYQTVYKKRKEVEGLFGKFVSPQVKKVLLEDPTLINYEGQRKVMTVLFTDLRGFTTISESNPPHQVINQLNDYLNEMVKIIINDYNGTLDKYMGDAVMAFWGDPLPQENHAELAVKAGLAMLTKLKELNKEWHKIGWPELDMGVGINTGEMTVGHLGGGILVDYTVIGDNVNIASRLESMNKEYSTNILISESTYQAVKDIFETREVDEKLLKGKTKLIKFYEVIKLKSLD